MFVCLFVGSKCKKYFLRGDIFISNPQYYNSNICEAEQTVQQLNRQSKVRQRGTNEQDRTHDSDETESKFPKVLHRVHQFSS